MRFGQKKTSQMYVLVLLKGNRPNCKALQRYCKVL